MSLIKDLDNNWSAVPQYIGDSYLGILAKYMADDYYYTPATNMVKKEDLIYSTENKTTGTPVGELLLLGCLPTPILNTPINEILKFKKQREDELTNFRGVLRNYFTKLNQSESENEIFEVLKEFEDEIKIGSNNLARQLNENKVLFKVNSLKTLLDIKKPALSGLISGILSSAVNTPPEIGASIGVASAVAGSVIDIGVKYMETRYNDQKEIRNSPYSYVFYTKQRL